MSKLVLCLLITLQAVESAALTSLQWKRYLQLCSPLCHMLTPGCAVQATHTHTHTTCERQLDLESVTRLHYVSDSFNPHIYCQRRKKTAAERAADENLKKKKGRRRKKERKKERNAPWPLFTHSWGTRTTVKYVFKGVNSQR